MRLCRLLLAISLGVNGALLYDRFDQELAIEPQLPPAPVPLPAAPLVPVKRPPADDLFRVPDRLPED